MYFLRLATYPLPRHSQLILAQWRGTVWCLAMLSFSLPLPMLPLLILIQCWENSAQRWVSRGEGHCCCDYHRFHSNHIEGRRERSHSMLSNCKFFLELIFVLKLIFGGVVIMGVVIIINRVWSMICWSVFIRFLIMLVWWVCPFIWYRQLLKARYHSLIYMLNGRCG